MHATACICNNSQWGKKIRQRTDWKMETAVVTKPWSLEITVLQVVDTSDAAAVPLPASLPVVL